MLTKKAMTLFLFHNILCYCFPLIQHNRWIHGIQNNAVYALAQKYVGIESNV